MKMEFRVATSDSFLGSYDVVYVTSSKINGKYRKTVATFRKFQHAVDYARLLSVLNDIPLKEKFDFT